MRSWIERLPKNVQCIVTSRPGYTDFASPDAVRIEIQPLSRDDVFYLLRGGLQDTVWEIERVEQWLAEHPDFIELLTCPRALVGFINQLVPISPARPSIDQDRIEPIAEYKPEIVFGNDDAPTIDIAPNPIQEELPTQEETSSTDERLLPPLALAVQGVTNFIRTEEVKRRQEWGQDYLRIAEQAKIELDEVAWYWDWNANGFDSKQCQNWITNASCQWNEDIGFIRYRYPRRYEFTCDLLHHYFCAEYAWDFNLQEEVIKARVIQQGTGQAVSQSVLNLLNEIRLENGRDPINLV